MTVPLPESRGTPSTKLAQWYGRIADQEKYLRYLFLGPTMLILVGVAIFPLVYSLRTSLTDFTIGLPQVRFVGLANFGHVFADSFFWNGLRLTAMFVAVTTSVSFGLGFAIAWWLQREFRFRSIVRTVVLSPMAIPPVVVGVIWLLLFMPDYSVISYFLESVGIRAPIWISTPGWALVTVMIAYVWEWTPFFVLMISAGLAAVPLEPLEAALVDGASRWQMLRHIIVPFLRPVLLLAVIIRIVDSFRVFDLVFVITRGGPGKSTQVLSLVVYLNGMQYRYIGYASAMSWIMVIILIILSMLLLRTLRQVRLSGE